MLAIGFDWILKAMLNYRRLQGIVHTAAVGTAVHGAPTVSFT